MFRNSEHLKTFPEAELKNLNPVTELPITGSNLAPAQISKNLFKFPVEPIRLKFFKFGSPPKIWTVLLFIGHKQTCSILFYSILLWTPYRAFVNKLIYLIFQHYAKNALLPLGYSYTVLVWLFSSKSFLIIKVECIFKI